MRRRQRLASPAGQASAWGVGELSSVLPWPWYQRTVDDYGRIEEVRAGFSPVEPGSLRCRAAARLLISLHDCLHLLARTPVSENSRLPDAY